jgi:hypothetical protein
MKPFPAAPCVQRASSLPGLCRRDLHLEKIRAPSAAPCVVSRCLSVYSQASPSTQNEAQTSCSPVRCLARVQPPGFYAKSPPSQKNKSPTFSLVRRLRPALRILRKRSPSISKKYEDPTFYVRGLARVQPCSGYSQVPPSQKNTHQYLCSPDRASARPARLIPRSPPALKKCRSSTFPPRAWPRSASALPDLHLEKIQASTFLLPRAWSTVHLPESASESLHQKG